ncbi:hypothetical protein N8691_02640 [Candidatus Pelagibacter sp.]|nr:hypothetical protein [Candidatus Pelagibacter sp.]
MKKLLSIMVLGLILSSNAYAEIIFKNCDLSPNLGKTDIKVFLEKNVIEMHHYDDEDIRIFAIEKTEGSNVYAKRLIGNPSDSEIKEWSTHDQNRYFNLINENIDETFLLNYNNGFVRSILRLHNGADQVFVDIFKDDNPKEQIETNCKVVNLYEKTEDTVSTSSTTQDQQYNSTPKFALVEKDKFYYKQLNKYSRMPEAVLCISYINAYGWYKREKKQAIKYEVIETRGINCDRYMDAAYYDKQRRSNEIADATKKAFDSGVDAAYGVTPESQRGNKMVCTTQRIGSSGMAKTTCRQK